jgi:CRISPR-associated exonuclease Cas4
MPYDEDDMLMLSGIQHFMFCQRQWALIHIEQQWSENKLTTEGNILHTNVDNPFYRIKNGETITLRSIHIASKRLGLYGITDAVELRASETEKNAIRITSYPGFWNLYPIEYKKGHSKPDERDEVQLAAQVICLEEMNKIEIKEAALYYNETKRREKICINNHLRDLTYKCANEMHELYKKGKTPPAEKKVSCRNCSLIDLCLPTLNKRKDVKEYLKENLGNEETT